jgi:hypothetical protein
MRDSDAWLRRAARLKLSLSLSLSLSLCICLYVSLSLSPIPIGQLRARRSVASGSRPCFRRLHRRLVAASRLRSACVNGSGCARVVDDPAGPRRIGAAGAAAPALGLDEDGDGPRTKHGASDKAEEQEEQW